MACNIPPWFAYVSPHLHYHPFQSFLMLSKIFQHIHHRSVLTSIYPPHSLLLLLLTSFSYSLDWPEIFIPHSMFMTNIGFGSGSYARNSILGGIAFNREREREISQVIGLIRVWFWYRCCGCWIESHLGAIARSFHLSDELFCDGNGDQSMDINHWFVRIADVYREGGTLPPKRARCKF